ncbi:MAG: hypothetical protein KDA83_21540 [Planctomycetales bacterium]|nr:hypothetical protein [Planctomycetales bacterium]
MSLKHPEHAPIDELPDVSLPRHSQKTTGHLPILFGVLAGLSSWVLLASIETPSLYWLSILIFGETSPKALFATPGYYCIHRTALLVMCAIGGGIGVGVSSMRKRTAVLFLFGVLAVVAVFAAIFPR